MAEEDIILTVMPIIYVYEERPSRRFARSLQKLNSCSSYTLLRQLYFTLNKENVPYFWETEVRVCKHRESNMKYPREMGGFSK